MSQPQTRREFLHRTARVGATAAGLILFAGCAANPGPPSRTRALPRIGVLSLEAEGLPPPFLQRLAELGYAEGQTIAIEYRSADSQPDRLPERAAELVRLGVDVIVPTTRQSILATKGATSSIPIVLLGAGVGDPVADGLVASLARPGGNVTGVTAAPPETNLKRLDLLVDAVPGVSRVGILGGIYGPGLSPERWEAVAHPLGVTVHPLPLGAGATPDQVRAAFEVAAREQVDALLRGTFGSTPAVERLTVDLAARARLPTIYPRRSFVAAGGLMAYDASVSGRARGAADYVDRILRGARPAELPVEQPTRYDLFINLQAAADLGITIRESVLAQASEVIR